MICNECETVAHCTKHGCIPKQPAPVQPVAFFDPQNGFYWAKPTKVTAPLAVAVEPMPLYTTPQEFVCSTGLCHYKAVSDAIHHTDLSEHPEYISGWNDYRKAMLEMLK
jgi:hypothetical protein